MTVNRWINDRENDNFTIWNDGRKLYDGRTTNREPAPYIMESMVLDIYEYDGVIIIEI